MSNFLAQSKTTLPGRIKGLGNYGFETTNPNTGPSLFNQIITVTIGLMTLIAFVWFVFLLISGGIAWMSSGGDSGKLAAARGRIVSGVVGLTIIVVAIFLTQIIAELLGVGNILNPGKYIKLLAP